MNLNINDNLFIVLGASSGFGKSVSVALLGEGAKVIAVARRQELLTQLSNNYPGKIETIQADVTLSGFDDALLNVVAGRHISGILINAGGPPASGFFETSEQMWLDAYHNVFLWKVRLLNRLLPLFMNQKYGRILFIESVSVKQPVENLILSNSIRAAVAGMVKTLAAEIANTGVTVNVLAPGYHQTAAMERLFAKRAQNENISIEAAKDMFSAETGMGFMGNPDDLAQLATWLLSPSSAFVTGQVISIAGNAVKGIMG